MRLINFCNTLIRWGFYAIFFLVPLVFVSDTSELFEFNKMWLTFIVTLIVGAAWITKTIAQKQVKIQRTIFDIPLGLFLLSQIISTIFSLDSHVSFWGYYSRFNGGLLSTIAYIFLYYTLVSNTDAYDKNIRKFIHRLLKVNLSSGLLVSLWGLPAHFGYDPTCLLFRGTLDVSCWTDAFQPKVRIFSSLGQPDWLAAYLAILIPIAIYFGFQAFKKNKYVTTAYYTLLTILFYLDFLFTRSKGGFIALTVAVAILFAGYFFFIKDTKNKLKFLGVGILIFFLCTFYADTPFPQFTKFTLSGVMAKLSAPVAAPVMPSPTGLPAPTAAPQPTEKTPVVAGELGGTDSSKIRMFVWTGAIQAWLHNPIFGTGVETFAFAYYRYRPAGHNLTSEWDYLYNKAHNEYLNYLATTGAFGLLTYLAFIALFLYGAVRKVNIVSLIKVFISKDKENKDASDDQVLSLTLICSFITILISNFFGFSVVIVNLSLFLIPAFFLLFTNALDEEKYVAFPASASEDAPLQYAQWIGISVAWIIALYCIIVLINFWNADKAYGYGSNLDKAGQFEIAYAPLHQAVSARTDEPVFKDELAVNDATLAVALAQQKDATNASRLAQEAIATSDDITTSHPNYLVFWKSRVRIMYQLAQVDIKYLPLAIQAIDKAHELAPTDAKIDYNRGLLYAQDNQISQAVSILEETVALKPDYRDAYFALAFVQRQAAVDKNNKIINPEMEKQAVNTLHYILNSLNPTDKQSIDTLKSWGEK